ncbi:MAG: hypothetical protein HYW63_00650 [Candidatus Levybacteria bacterium]|nr:hypothetical protein [Candidatus Levybacteria bacterium]
MKIKKFLLNNSSEIIVFLIGIAFGTFLMFSSFSSGEGIIMISSKAWSDFASHIPLIRSFSLGSNFPPEYPLFPGEPIKYHFIFYYIVGLLEKIGLPIGLALNIPSAIGFIFLVLIIYYFSKQVFKSKSVGLLSVVFFLFNSSLSFIYYFRQNPLSTQSILQIPNTTNFQSFAPYGQGIISAFWNLNIYTNQRHLAVSFALSFIIIYLAIKPILGEKTLSARWYFILGIVLGLSFFIHTAVFLMSSVVLLSLAVLFSKIRKGVLVLLILAAIIAFPQYLYLTGSDGYSPNLVLGYLLANDLTFQKFIEFWIYNLGLSLILIPFGFIFATKFQRKILLAFFSLFIIGNTIQFSPEIAANHKFFNYFIVIGNMFSAFALLVLWNKKHFFKPIVIMLFLFMVFGGIIDFFPIYNDHKISIDDYKKNPDANWILTNTPSNSIFLNSTYLYNPASLSGRKIFMGWPYFAWSQGYDTDARGKVMKDMLSAKSKSVACDLLKRYKIDFVEIRIQNPPDPNIPNISLLYENEFIKSYENKNKNYSIYNVVTNCLP